MTKPFQCYIENVQLVTLDENTSFLYGVPINDIRFVDWLRTSPIMQAYFDDDSGDTIVETKNSIYKVKGKLPPAIRYTNFISNLRKL